MLGVSLGCDLEMDGISLGLLEKKLDGLLDGDEFGNKGEGQIPSLRQALVQMPISLPVGLYTSIAHQK